MNSRAVLNGLLAVLLAACASTTGTPVAPTATVAPTQPPATPVPATSTSVPTATSAPSATAAATATAAPTVTATPAAIADVIAYEMRGSFDFFWEQANTDPASPGYGLIRDRFPGSEGIASIASVGFGLTALIIGVDEGYVTRAEAEARAAGTLATLAAMERTEGFYYHFVSLSTGQRAWDSEVSSIDTSILMLGVLAAGEYFGGDVAIRAQALYNAVNWPWFLDPANNMFYMAYRPEEGFGGHWDYYAEQLMLYVLAAGSPTHPVDSGPYYAFTRQRASNGDGPEFIHSWFGSLFTYQYSHAWIDFRGLTDNKGINWFDNSVAASQSQVAYATKLDAKWETLGPNAWGLTASDGPNGYEGRYGAPPSGNGNRENFIDDTIAPSGAIGSIIFTTADSERAMLNYYSLPQLQSAYGFVDAYNLTEGWFDTDVIGIDKGVSLLMLSNYLEGPVYPVMLQNSVIAQGLEVLGLTARAGRGEP